MLRPSHLEEEARTVARAAQNRGVVIRSMGSTAIRIHCPRLKDLHTLLGREPNDFNFMSTAKRKDIAELFREMAYEPQVGSYPLRERVVFWNPNTNLLAQVFFDRLSMCHTIDFRERLELDSPTITLADLVLEKGQIVKITEDDLKDLAVLFLEHDIGESEREKIDDRYIRELLSKDWGFYYTVTTNLKKVKDRLATYEPFDDSQHEQIKARIDQLLTSIENEPKSTGWRMRATIGTSRIWYTEIE
jgi:hypothetical protein